MKKKIVLGLFITLSLFMVTACGNKKDLSDDNTNGINEENQLDDTYEDIELYSDDTKIVFSTDYGKVVFYYKNNTITGEHAYFDYQNNATAKVALTALNNEENDNVARAYVKGKYLVIEYNENEYGTLTLKDVKIAYSYLEEVKKSN